jgi:type IV secretion system protein VirB1
VFLTVSVMLGLAQRCAPAVAPETMLSVARAESAFDPFVVAANTNPRRVFHPASAEAATRLADRLIGAGQSVDLGLGQINSRNLQRLGLEVADAFDPCRNLAASARVLQASYRRASPDVGSEQRALRTALSLYNTGDAERGVRNGYVGRVTEAARRIVPALKPSADQPATQADIPADLGADIPRPSLDVFARPAAAAVAF